MGGYVYGCSYDPFSKVAHVEVEASREKGDLKGKSSV